MFAAGSSFPRLSVVAAGVFLLAATGLRADELTEQQRKDREREEGMYRQIENVNKPPPSSSSSSSPGVGDFLGDMQQRMDAARARRQQQERQIQLQRQLEREERDAEEAADARVRYRQSEFADLAREAEGGDETAQEKLAFHYLAGTYAKDGVPQNLALAEKFMRMIVEREDKPGAVGYYGHDILILGGLQYLRGDHEAALKTWARLDKYSRADGLCAVAAACSLALRLTDTEPQALSPAQQRLAAGLLVDRMKVALESPAPVGFEVEARLVLDAFGRHPELVPVENHLNDLWRYYHYYKKIKVQPDLTAFEPKDGPDGSKVGKAPVAPLPYATRMNLWRAFHVLEWKGDEYAKQLIYGWEPSVEKMPELRELGAALIAETADRFKYSDEDRRYYLLNWNVRFEKEDSSAARELFELHHKRFVHAVIAEIAGNRPNSESDLCAYAESLCQGFMREPVPLTEIEKQQISAIGQRWSQSDQMKVTGRKLVALGVVVGGAPPVDGEAAVADIGLVREIFGDRPELAAVALYGGTHGPEELRPVALRELAKFDLAKAIELAEPLATRGVAAATALMAELSYPCEETVPAMQRARRWKLAVRGEGAGAGGIQDIEDWLRTHGAVENSYSPALHEALAALHAAAPETRRAAVDRLAAVVKDEYLAGSFFAYDELRRFACSPDDRDGQAAKFLSDLVSNNKNSAVTPTTVVATSLRHDGAALLIRAAARSEPDAVALFRQPAADRFSEEFDLNEAFDAIEPEHWDSLIALASIVEAKTGDEIVRALQRSIQEPATPERLVRALRAGTHKACAALNGYPFQTKCLGALCALAPQMKAHPEAWKELLAAIAQFPGEPFHWTENFGPFHGALYATYFECGRLQAAGQSVNETVAAYCRGKKPGVLVGDAFTIGQELEYEPMYPDIAYLHDADLARAILERAIAAGAHHGDELRRRLKEKVALGGQENFDLVHRGELWPLPAAPAETASETGAAEAGKQ